MTKTPHKLIELGQAANQVLTNVRKMTLRGDTRSMLESYLTQCRECFLKATSDAQRFTYHEMVEDVARAIRHSRPNAEFLGALVVISVLSQQDGLADFRCFSLSVGQRLRAEMRDHARHGVCDPADIKLGAELAVSSLQPLVAA